MELPLIVSYFLGLNFCQIIMGGQDPHKILLLGGRGVGKTCIDFQIRHDDFRFSREKDYKDVADHDSYRKDNFMVDGVAHTFQTFEYAVCKYSNIFVIIILQP